jgi:hypothetical protein
VKGNREVVIRNRDDLSDLVCDFVGDFILKLKSRPSINAEIFLDSIQSAFLFVPNLIELWTLDEFAEEIGV